MECENTPEFFQIMEKFEHFSFLEFSVKPSLFEEYIISLKNLKKFEICDSIFENFLENLIKSYSKHQNPYLMFSLEICQKFKKIAKLFHLLTIVNFLTIYIYILNVFKKIIVECLRM